MVFVLVLDRQKTVRVHMQMLPAGFEHTVLLVWVRPVKPWDIPKLYFLQWRKKSVLLRETIFTIAPYACMYIYVWDVNSSKIEAKRRQAFTFISLLCEATWQPRHHDRRGLYHLVMRSQQAWSQCALNCQGQRRRDEALHSNPWLTYILSISNVSLTGINGAVMDSEKPR